MKKLFIIGAIFNLSLHAQDTIRFRNGETKAVKVSEIGIDEIKYNRFDNIGGPLYIASKNEVQLIKYSNGHVDSFAVTKPAVTKPDRVAPEQSFAQNGLGKIIISNNRLYYNNKGVGESHLLKMIMAHPDNKKQNLMLKSFKEMKQHKKKQYLIGFIGLGVGVGVAYAGFIGALISENEIPAAVGLVAGAGIGITCAVISGINKKQRLIKKLEVVRIYNGD